MLILGGLWHTYLAIRGITVLWGTSFGICIWLESKVTDLTFQAIDLPLRIDIISTLNASINTGAVEGE